RPLLEIEGLTKRFGGLSAADDITFTVKAGELISVIGPNGSGKTTLFNLITGLIRPDGGSIRLEGREIGRGPPPPIHPRGGGPHLSEHPPLQQPQRDGEPPGRRARAPRCRRARRDLPAAPRAPRGAARCPERPRGRRDLRQPADAAARPSRVRALLRQPPPH